MAKTYRGILIFVVILGIVMGLAGKKFDGYVYTNTEPRSNTECTLTQRVFDDADVLTDEEEAKLEKLIAEKEKLIGGDIVLMTTNDASLNTMEKLRDYAQNYYVDQWQQVVDDYYLNFYVRHPEYLEMLPENEQLAISNSLSQVRQYNEMPLKILKAEQLVGGEEAMDQILHDLFNRELDPMYPYLTYQEFLDACGLTEEDLNLA